MTEEENDNEENAKQPRATTTAHKRIASKARPKSPGFESEVEQAVTGAPATKATTSVKSNPRSRSRSGPVNPDAKDLSNEDIVMMDEYIPSPTPIQQHSTTTELAPLFVPKRTKGKGAVPTNGPSNDSGHFRSSI